MTDIPAEPPSNGLLIRSSAIGYYALGGALILTAALVRVFHAQADRVMQDPSRVVVVLVMFGTAWIAFGLTLSRRSLELAGGVLRHRSVVGPGSVKISELAGIEERRRYGKYNILRFDLHFLGGAEPLVVHDYAPNSELNGIRGFAGSIRWSSSASGCRHEPKERHGDPRRVALNTPRRSLSHSGAGGFLHRSALGDTDPD